MTPVSHGKPCAGNPHARFDEGGVRIGGTEAERSTPQRRIHDLETLLGWIEGNRF